MPSEICDMVRCNLTSTTYDFDAVTCNCCPSQPSSQPSSKPTEACAAITNQKDALLALKEGFTNGDTALASWVTTTDPSTGPWTRITCDSDGKVTDINLCK
jgi:hypothetical protein